ncbi:RNA polymerase sigma-70 factor [Sphingobacterium psychroaquaticum]|uniref:RNA polymerase sigma-70 factor, ECF subfamily n=1 Tax=Sphingobacterium psychroaquaticum TaxID=561061 RepID=A0A1X7KRJ4_9SPHI|nr:RNA polymerase sigma-70 factor [Sphingobacterium psychroaquaticum]QBQ40572.1 RNA polymerase sigma-70 factor [Sphingobacterium psychroaquaticum]SMG43780.1 RNA polymerase sigma-70 factor, ECF subfamily [Sphingobacterium psychroaquaticum]
MNIFDKHKYEHLVNRLSQGDHQAFEELYHIFYPDLAAHVLSKVNDDAVAQDILHDLFYSLWKNHEKIAQIQSLPAYLFTSCRYLVMAYFQKAYLIDKQQNVEDLEIHSTQESIEDQLFNRHLLDIIQTEVENLPEKCRLIFKMSREDQKSIREIAQELNISESTVENQINKALKRIRTATKNFLHTVIVFF